MVGAGLRAIGQRSETVRRANLSAIIRELHLHGPASRSALVARTGLTRSAIGSLIGEFVGAGFVTEERATPRGLPGRPSPLVRARQTAEHIGARLGLAVVIDDRLAGSGGVLGPAALDAILSDQGDPDRPILVGHDPDFSDLVASLAGASDVPMRKGTLARIDLDRPLQAGAGVLVFLLPPEVIARP